MSPTLGGPPMRLRLHGRTLITIVGALLALQWSLTAQSPATAAKRPLTYDVMDYWKSIQGTRLSDDGQWLAYATTGQGEDGEPFVRNLRSGQEFKQARGTAPAFTPDGKFLIFTIAQPKADEEREAASERGAGGGETPAAAPEAQGTGRAGRRGNGRGREPRTGMGIMTLPSGEVKTFEKVGSFSLPEKSSTWLAYHKGLGGAGGGGGRGGGRGGARRAVVGAVAQADAAVPAQRDAARLPRQRQAANRAAAARTLRTVRSARIRAP